YHVLFRLGPSQYARSGTILWRTHALGLVELPYLGRERFLRNLRIDAPTIFARLGGQLIACSSFVEGTASELLACGLLRSPGSLLPLLDSGLTLELSANGNQKRTISLQMTAAQLLGREALVAAPISDLHMTVGAWTASWRAGGRVLACQD